MIDQSNSNNLFGQGVVQKQNSAITTPGSIKQTSLTADFIKNSDVFVSGAISLTNGNSLVIQSIITSNTNPNLKLAGVPYSITFFQGSLATSNMIGITITGSGYQIKGPQALPVFTPNAQNLASTIYGGSTGANLVYVTELYNNTGSTQTIFYITNTRFIQSGGSAG